MVDEKDLQNDMEYDQSSPTPRKRRLSGVLFEAVSGRSYSGAGVLRYHATLCHALILLLLALLAWQSAQWRQLQAQILKEREPIVIHDQCGVTTAHKLSDLSNGPSDAQIQSVAWEIVAKLKGSGSIDVDEKYSEVRKYFTKDLQDIFDSQKLKEYRKTIKQLRIYRDIKGKVRQLEEADLKDLPPEMRAKIGSITNYDVFVNGEVNTFDLDSKSQKDRGTIKLWLRMVPGVPSWNNYTGLSVSHIISLDKAENPQTGGVQ